MTNDKNDKKKGDNDIPQEFRDFLEGIDGLDLESAAGLTVEEIVERLRQRVHQASLESDSAYQEWIFGLMSQVPNVRREAPLSHAATRAVSLMLLATLKSLSELGSDAERFARRFTSLTFDTTSPFMVGLLVGMFYLGVMVGHEEAEWGESTFEHFEEEFSVLVGLVEGLEEDMTQYIDEQRRQASDDADEEEEE